MTPIQKLDKCLLLLSNTDIAFNTADMISKYLNLENTETIEILNKLVEDKNATKHKGEYMDTYWYSYKITFMGRLFISQGGYEHKLEVENRTNPLQKLKVGLLNAAAFVGGLYYFLEIIRIYIAPVIQNLCDCVFVWQKTS